MASTSTPSRSATFTGLSIETKMSIIYTLLLPNGTKGDMDKSNALALSLVNREFNDLVKPVLFRNINISKKTIAELERFSVDVPPETRQHIRDVTFTGNGPRPQLQSHFSNMITTEDVACRRRTLAARILAELSLHAVEFSVDYHVTTHSGLEVLFAIEGEVAEGLGFLKMDGSAARQRETTLPPAPIASLLFSASNLWTLILHNVGLGTDRRLWSALASLGNLLVLELERVAFAPTLDFEAWDAELERLTLAWCPGADVLIYAQMANAFADSLTHLRLALDPPSPGVDVSFTLPRLVDLELHGENAVDNLPFFEAVPVDLLTLKYEGGGPFFVSSARLRLLDGVKLVSSTLKAFTYNESLLDCIDMDEFQECRDFLDKQGIAWGMIQPDEEDEMDERFD